MELVGLGGKACVMLEPVAAGWMLLVLLIFLELQSCLETCTQKNERGWEEE